MRVVIMGVSGCGKSTLGAALAKKTGSFFADADDFHPTSNRAKMSAGIPLTDEDRWPWLADVGEWLAKHPEAVVACSALKRAYRDFLQEYAGEIFFVHLAAPQKVLEERVRNRRARTGHFASPGILDGQYRDLEQLRPDEQGVTINVEANHPDKALALAVAAVSRR